MSEAYSIGQRLLSMKDLLPADHHTEQTHPFLHQGHAATHTLPYPYPELSWEHKKEMCDVTHPFVAPSKCIPAANEHLE
ncbi:hypothetical protein U0070_014407 [Myodes glareolus]|uniref:Uncharacterized protein n=1 Tax=Myodes glareolus TaxID=447135 RepID=A0AAW0J6X1_MYOGA